MICSNCKQRIPLNHRPGVFLSVAAIATMVGGLGWVFLQVPYGIVVVGGSLLIALISLGGVLTQMTDASAWVYSRLKRQGVECDSCHHMNPIRPWTL